MQTAKTLIADAQADLSLRWAHTHFVGFVMRRLILWSVIILLKSSHLFYARNLFSTFMLKSIKVLKLYKTKIFQHFINEPSEIRFL